MKKIVWVTSKTLDRPEICQYWVADEDYSIEAIPPSKVISDGGVDADLVVTAGLRTREMARTTTYLARQKVSWLHWWWPAPKPSSIFDTAELLIKQKAKFHWFTSPSIHRHLSFAGCSALEVLPEVPDRWILKDGKRTEERTKVLFIDVEIEDTQQMYGICSYARFPFEVIVRTPEAVQPQDLAEARLVWVSVGDMPHSLVFDWMLIARANGIPWISGTQDLDMDQGGVTVKILPEWHREIQALYDMPRAVMEAQESYKVQHVDWAKTFRAEIKKCLK